MNDLPALPDAVRRRRLRGQRLDDGAGADDADVAGIVRAVGGIQAQDMHAAMLGVVVRGPAARARAIAAELPVAQAHDRTIVRAWCMRGTLHLVPADLLPNLLTVFAPVHIRRGRRRLAALGLDERACARGVHLIADVLAGQALRTRGEIATAVRQRGLALDLRGQAPIHLVRRACLEGVACEAGSRDRQPLYGLRSEWFPGPPPAPRDDALGELARWYLTAFGPASRDDFAAWSGLPAGDVRQAWDHLDDLVEVHPGLWTCGPDPGAPAAPDPVTVRLAPAFDGYLLGYRGRAHAVAPAHRTLVHPGGGIVRPTLLVDGRVAGTWRIERTRLAVTTFAGAPGVPVGALDAEVARVGAALAADLRLTMVG
jgi:hypothetical protein